MKYAIIGLPQQVFVSKYLINLPTEKQLQKIIEEEKENLEYLRELMDNVNKYKEDN